MDRIYTKILKNHFAEYPQMAFLVGPRQVGKTTIAKQVQEQFHDWKNYLKGFFDLYKDHFHILVIGSARLDIYQSRSDSLMGRYFQYTVHPLSLGEVLNPDLMQELHQPVEDFLNQLATLLKYGGFAEPFLKQNERFSSLWRTSRLKQLLFEDVLTLSTVHDVQLIEVLAELLKAHAGQLLNKSALAKKIKVTAQTVSRWIETLERFYYCFLVPPWHKNVARSLIKEPKLYLWDWSVLADEAARYENMLAVSLLKFTKFWSEQGLEKFNLYFLRDIDKRAVDFLITRDNVPFIMVAATFAETLADGKIPPSLPHFQAQLSAPHALQVVYQSRPIEQSCFRGDGAIHGVPAATFLSQLV